MRRTIIEFIKDKLIFLGRDYPISEEDSYEELRQKISENNKIRYFIMAVFIVAPFLLRILADVRLSFNVSLVVSFMVVYTFLSQIVVSRRIFKDTISLSNFYLAFLAVGDLFITIPLLFHYMGGLAWAHIVILCYYIIYGYSVFPRYWQAGILAVCSFLSGLVVGLLDYFQILSPVNNFPGLMNYPQLDFQFLFSTLIVLFIVLYFIAYWSYTFSRYLKSEKENLREIKIKLEEAKEGLELKVRARTDELEKLSEELEGQVKERTRQLQERVGELERFRKLTVGRELKMIELKKEIERLKKLC